MSLVAQQARVGLRGYRFKERSLGPEDDDERARVDLYWMRGARFGPIDTLRAMDFQVMRAKEGSGSPSGRGDGARAKARIEEHFSRLKAALMLRTEQLRLNGFSLFTNVALQAGDLRAARHWSKRLSHEKSELGRALAEAARAGVLALMNHDDAPTVYEQAAVRFDALDMVPFAAAARRRRGELLGGDEGARLVAEMDALLERRQVKAPARWMRMLVS